MKKEVLFQAISGIDEELLRRSEVRVTRRPLRLIAIAAAAIMLLSLTAFASPAVRNWFFGSSIEHERDSDVLEYRDGSLGYQFDEYRVDMICQEAAEAPTEILEYRLPAYFPENGWICDPAVITPDLPQFTAHYLWLDPEDPTTGISFTQDTFTEMTGYPRGWNQFRLNGGYGAEIETRNITIGQQEALLYIVRPSDLEGMAGDPGSVNLFWADGEYAYMLYCDYQYRDNLDLLEQIVLSLAPVENIEVYATGDPNEDDPMEPITEFYSLGTAEGFTLQLRDWQFNNAMELWANKAGDEILLEQSRKLSPTNTGPALSIEDTLRNREENSTLQTLEGDVLALWETGKITLMWEDEDHIFFLTFRGSFRLNAEELLAWREQVAPMADFTDNLTR